DDEPLAEGYARGFGLLQGCAVDPRLSEGAREDSLRGIAAAHPLLAVGLEPGALLLVDGHRATVQGAGRVRLFDGRAGGAAADGANGSSGVREAAFGAGEGIDLATGDALR